MKQAVENRLETYIGRLVGILSKILLRGMTGVLAQPAGDPGHTRTQSGIQR